MSQSNKSSRNKSDSVIKEKSSNSRVKSKEKVKKNSSDERKLIAKPISDKDEKIVSSSSKRDRSRTKEKNSDAQNHNSAYLSNTKDQKIKSSVVVQSKVKKSEKSISEQSDKDNNKKKSLGTAIKDRKRDSKPKATSSSSSVKSITPKDPKIKVSSSRNEAKISEKEVRSKSKISGDKERTSRSKKEEPKSIEKQTDVKDKSKRSSRGSKSIKKETESEKKTRRKPTEETTKPRESKNSHKKAPKEKEIAEATLINKRDSESLHEEPAREEVILENSQAMMVVSLPETQPVEPVHNSLDTLESGISMTSPVPQDLSDCEVEESISSKFVEVDEMEINDECISSASQNTNLNNSIINNEDSQDYEEDFEDYDSEFEEESEENNSEESESSEDEPIDEEEMKEILRAVELENNRPKVSYKEETPQDVSIPKAQPEKSILKQQRPKTSRAFVNFARAKEKTQENKVAEKMKTRGQILQAMIQLDEISIELFTQLSDSYEAYIAAFGRSNAIQIGVQTNEDALSEAVQTDNPVMLNKWTQNPVSSSSSGGDYSGVGGDQVPSNEGDPYATYFSISSDSGRLTKFLNSSSQVILQLLEEESILTQDTSMIITEDESLGFSRSGIALGSLALPLLEGRPSTFVSFCPAEPTLVLTGHGFKNQGVNSEGNESEQGLKNNELDDANSSLALLCLWSAHQPSFAKFTLSCRAPAVAASFSPGRPVVIIGGLSDGSLAAWDLRENDSSHQWNIAMSDHSCMVRPPSFITACGSEGRSEGSQIVAVQTLQTNEESELHNSSFQVVSLTSCGQITWWVLVQDNHQVSINSEPNVSVHLGAAPWARISLLRAATISLTESISSDEMLFGCTFCRGLQVSHHDPNSLFVGTANGNVHHSSRHNIKLHPSAFTPEIEFSSEVVSISVCPHDPEYLLVGGSDGTVRLHTINASSPLTTWQVAVDAPPVIKVQWSSSRPCVFYMLDASGMFHIWDLSAGDIFPVISVPDGDLIGGQLVDFDVAPSTFDNDQPVYVIFSSDSGSIGLRSISDQFLRVHEEDYKNELHRFKCYVNII